MKKCGLDLDGVVYDFITPFDKFLTEQGFELDKTKYDRGLNRKDIKFQLHQFSKQNPFSWIPLYEGVKENLERLSDFMTFDVVTHRDWYSGARSQTHYRLFSDKIPRQHTIFSEPDKKLKWARYLQHDYFIEDSLGTANQIARGSLAKVFLVDREYNQGDTALNVVRIKSLEDMKW